MSRALGVSSEGDKQLAQAVYPYALQEYNKLIERLDLRKSETGRHHYTVRVVDKFNRPIEGQVYVDVLQNIARMHIVVDTTYNPRTVVIQESSKFEAYASVPDFLSGFVYVGFHDGIFKGRITVSSPDKNEVYNKDYINAFEPTELCKKQQKITSQEVYIQRLAVQPDVMFDGDFTLGRPTEQGEVFEFPDMSVEEFKEKGLPDKKASGSINPDKPFAWSQYQRLRPTLWTGKMRRLVQYLMGIGKVPPSPWFGEFEQTKEGLNSNTSVRFSNEHLEDIAKNGVQIKFDYRSLQSDGIIYGEDTEEGLKTPYIVQISQSRGVSFVRLPMFNRSNTKEFYDFIKAKENSADVQLVIDLFGGLPSGEGVPRSVTDWEALRKAGLLVNPITGDAIRNGPYQGSALSSAMGWAFSESGKSAVNVMAEYPLETATLNDQYIKTKLWRFDFTVKNGDRRESVTNNASLPLAAYIQTKEGSKAWQRLSAIEQQMCLYKAQFLHDIGSGILEYVKDAELTPSFEATTSMTVIMEGKVNSNATGQVVSDSSASFTPGGPIASVDASIIKGKDATDLMKFYEPLYGPVLISFDTTPKKRGTKLEEDAPVFACFHGEDLKWVKKFKTHKGDTNPVTTGEIPGGCLDGMSYTISTKSGAHINPEFYSSDFDFRGDYRSSEQTSTYEAGHPVQVGWYPWAPGDGPWTARVCAHTIKSSSTNSTGRARHAYVCAPMYDRASYVFHNVVSTSSSASADYEGISQGYVCSATAFSYGTRSPPGGCGDNVPYSYDLIGGISEFNADCGVGPVLSGSPCSPMSSITFSGGGNFNITNNVVQSAFSIDTSTIYWVYEQNGASKVKSWSGKYTDMAGIDYINEWWAKKSPSEDGEFTSFQAFPNALGSSLLVSHAKDMGDIGWTIEGTPTPNRLFTPVGVID